MPNIFPSIQNPSPTAMVDPTDLQQVPQASILGSVNGPSRADLALNAAQAKLQSDTPQKYDYSAHSVLGNVGHVLGRVGNIAGDILDPEAASLIPHSDLWNARRLYEDQGNVDTATKNQQESQRESNTVANEQANREAEQPLRDSEVAKNNSAVDAEQHPTWQHLETDQGIFALNPKTNELMPLTYQGKPLQKPAPKPEKPDTPEQQYIDEYQKTHQGASIAEAERHYTLDTQRPPQIAPVMMMVPNANGGATATAVHPGQTIAPGATTTSQFGSENVPTSQQRNAAGRAQLVLQSIPDVLKDLDENKEQLGPGMGRFNDIYSGKVGAPNPQFAGLMSDLKLMGTAVALAHAQGRMSNELLNEFNSMIASPQQSPENIKAVLGKVQNFMERSAQQGKFTPQSAATEGAGKVDYVFKDGKLVKQ